MYAHIKNSIVDEVINLRESQTLEDLYSTAFIDECVPCPGNVEVGWRYNGWAFYREEDGPPSSGGGGGSGIELATQTQYNAGDSTTAASPSQVKTDFATRPIVPHPSGGTNGQILTVQSGAYIISNNTAIAALSSHDQNAGAHTGRITSVETSLATETQARTNADSALSSRVTVLEQSTTPPDTRTWEDVRENRTLMTEYTNTTTLPIVITCRFSPQFLPAIFVLYVNGKTVDMCERKSSDEECTLQGIVGVGNIYKVSTTVPALLENWLEFR